LPETLGVKSAIALTFDIAGSKVTAKVTSLRKVDWDSFRVNFFGIVSARTARCHAGHLYLRRFAHQRPTCRGARGWSKNIRNILVIDIGEIVRQVQGHHGQRFRALLKRVSGSHWGGLAGIAGGDRRDGRTAQVRPADSAHARRIASATVTVQVEEFLPAGRAGGPRRRRGRDGPIGWALADRVSDPVRGESLVFAYGLFGGAIAVTLGRWLGTRATTRRRPS